MYATRLPPNYYFSAVISSFLQTGTSASLDVWIAAARIASQLFSSNGLGLLFNIWSILSLFFYNLMKWKFGGTAVSYCLVLFLSCFSLYGKAFFFFNIYLNDFFVLGNFFFLKMDINKARKNMEKRKKNRQVRGPGLYKKILLVQKRPNIQQASKSVLFTFLVYPLLLLVTTWTRDKHGQMRPRVKVFCW